MKKQYSLWFSILILLSGCAAFQVAGEVQNGRYDLLTGRTDAALEHFQRAAQLDPDYRTDFTRLQESVWSYLGRAYYEKGNNSEARKALERARSRYEYDYLARLYLGLTLGRDRDRHRGLKEIEAGLSGLYNWLEYITYNTYYGQFWDPQREIRSEIQRTLAVVPDRDIDWSSLIASAEWVGKKMEDEIDLARRDEVKERNRQSERKNKKK